MKKPNVIHHQNDLPSADLFSESVAVDTEAMGLKIGRDRLSLVQLSAGDGTVHLVQFSGKSFNAPNLKRVLANSSILKIFHFARFDVANLEFSLGVKVNPIYCTKIASKLARTYTDRHGLKELCRELLGTDISKQEQCSDWGAPMLTPEQMKYASNDVAHLHKLKEKLDVMLFREGRVELAQECFNALPIIARLEYIGFDPEIVFGHAS